jgi:drug/metabolite transporter (DMT)-like permease
VNATSGASCLHQYNDHEQDALLLEKRPVKERDTQPVVNSCMTTSRNPIFRATLLIVVSACCFGSLTTITLLAMQTGMSLVNVIFWRFSIAAVLLAAITWRARNEHQFGRAASRLMVIGGIAQAVISYLSFKALDYLPVGALAFLFYTYPAWVAIFSSVRGKEALTRARLLALMIAMVGIAVMVGAPRVKVLSTIGILMALGTALLYALYLPLIYEAQKELPSLVSSFYLVTGIAITFLVVSLATGGITLPATPVLSGYLLLLSVVGTVFAFATLMAGLHVLGPVRTSIISTVEPFFTAILGAVVLGQGLTLAIIAGGILIAAAVIILEQNSVSEESIDAWNC